MDFRQAEKKFKQLKNQFEAGELTENEMKAQLEKLMIQDEHKHWWVMGYESELWYRHDGKDWIQTKLPSGVSEELTSLPGWIILIWLTLGGAVGGAVGGTAAWTIGGTISGLVTAVTFRIERVLLKWLSLLWILLAWTIGGASSWAIYRATTDAIGELLGLVVGGATGWAVGGFFTALTLKGENVLSSWNSVLWITLAWTIGGSIGWIIGWAISGEFNIVIGWAIGWAISWAIGGFVTIWQIREGKS
jgi:hypothetical protein